METTAQPQPRRNITRTPYAGNWNLLKEFRDEATGLTVIAQGRPGPEYRITASADQRLVVENALVKIQHNGTVLGRLWDEAQLYVQERRQAIEDDEMEHRQYLEHRELERLQGTQKLVPGLSKFTPGSKTEREAATGKSNRHEQNVTARQSTDRERTSRTKGRGK